MADQEVWTYLEEQLGSIQQIEGAEAALHQKMMELESDMVSTKMRYHKNEEKMTRQMEK